MSKSSGVDVTTGQFSHSMWRVLHLQHITTFSAKRTPLVMLPWKVIFLGNISGSHSAGKILTCLFPFLMFLLNLCLPLKTDTRPPKFEKASFTAWSLMSSGR